MAEHRQLSRRAKRRAIEWVVFFFLVLVLLTVLVTSQRAAIRPEWLWGLATPSNVDAFLASLWASIVVTFFVGLLTFALSVRNPEDDEIGQRVRNLYPRRDGPPGCNAYLQERAAELAAVAKHGTVTVQVKEFDARLQAYKIHVECQYALVNMLLDLECRSPIPVRVAPDPVDADPLGEVYSIRSWSANAPMVHTAGASIPRGQTYMTTHDVVIARAGESTYAYSFWAWMKIGVPWIVSTRFFAHNVAVTLLNDLPGGAPVDVECYPIDDNTPGNKRTMSLLRRKQQETLFPSATLADPHHQVAFTLSPRNAAGAGLGA